MLNSDTAVAVLSLLWYFHSAVGLLITEASHCGSGLLEFVVRKIDSFGLVPGHSEDVAPGCEGLWSKGSATKPAQSQNTFGGVVVLGFSLCALFFVLAQMLQPYPEPEPLQLRGVGGLALPTLHPHFIQGLLPN